MKPKKVCFISLKSYPLFAKNSNAYFGGAEVQMSLIAKELAKDNQFIVSLISGNYGQRRKIKRRNLTLFRTKILDFFNLLQEINADVYVERTINPKVFLIGWLCKLFKKKFVYMVAHDWDCSYPGLKLAHLIIAQHQKQKDALKKNLGLDSLVMPSLIKITSGKQVSGQKYVLWVGRANDWKKPLDFIDLVRSLPQEKFVMICREGKNKTLFNQVQRQAKLLSNLAFYSAVAPEKIHSFFLKAKVLVNTSTAEGFPNTFLQAGAAKIPLLSFRVNPDNYIKKYFCGLIGRNQLKQMLANPERLKQMGLNHYRFVTKNHSFKNLNILKQSLYRL